MSGFVKNEDIAQCVLAVSWHKLSSWFFSLLRDYVETTVGLITPE